MNSNNTSFSTFSPQTYPYPDTTSKSNEFDVEEYEEACMVWRKSLPDFVVRALAADFRMGKQTAENYDAMLEYKHRGLDRKDIVARLKTPSYSSGKRRKS